jgi:hypothetical protein
MMEAISDWLISGAENKSSQFGPPRLAKIWLHAGLDLDPRSNAS